MTCVTLPFFSFNFSIEFTLGQPFAKFIPATWRPATEALLDFSQTHSVSINICAVRSLFFNFGVSVIFAFLVICSDIRVFLLQCFYLITPLGLLLSTNNLSLV
jgi:hypothetical protein